MIPDLFFSIIFLLCAIFLFYIWRREHIRVFLWGWILFLGGFLINIFDFFVHQYNFPLQIRLVSDEVIRYGTLFIAVAGLLLLFLLYRRRKMSKNKEAL